ncbi:c-type cytochrome [Sagittula salina]|uniref:C-type cytochrome n=1 Tax=Sagittula salina TaxID=2820268 RepID=A0A940MSY2_9RHOB|nr:c-type cytochrome [Sagittula salina]MBP0484088.1 c-type cytochrome [Sagittula salina]
MSKSLNLYAGSAIGVALLLTAAYNFADRNVAPYPKNPPMLASLPAPIPEPAAPVQAKATAAANDQVAEASLTDGLLVGAAEADTAPAGLRFGLGRAAMPEEISAWDVKIMPDGTGLPAGSGNALDGEPLFEENCAVCHGSFAEGVDNWPKLAGGDGTLAAKDPLKTVGSYWPYLSTVWDYVHRSMPFGNAQSLTPDEVYAITAYILYSNDLIDDDFELSPETWNEVEMPNADGFIVDDRADTEYTEWRTDEPCMENCKPEPVKITMRATVLDVTPDQAGDEAPADAAEEMNHSNDAATVQPTDEAAADEAPAAATEAVDEAAADAGADMGAPDPELVAAGEKIFKKCKACHQVGEGAKNKSGPQLNGVVGRDIAAVDGFKYSNAMQDLPGDWTHEALAAFLAKPKDYVKGTKMSFAGLKKDDDIEAVIAYLQSYP